MEILLSIMIGSVLFLLIVEFLISQQDKIDDEIISSLKYAIKHKLILSEHDLVYGNKSNPGYVVCKLEMFRFLTDFVYTSGRSKYVYSDFGGKYVQHYIYLKYMNFYSVAVITIMNGKTYVCIEPCEKNVYKGRSKLFKL